MLVTDLYNVGGLPNIFIDNLLKVCPDCETPLVITDSLKELYCPNPHCMGKASQRLLALLTDLGVKNMGESRCIAYIDEMGTSNPYVILSYTPEQGAVGGMSEEFMSGIYEQINAHRRMMLWEYVRMGNLPCLRDSARNIFCEYYNLDDFYADLERRGVDLIQEKLGIRKEVISTRALNIYDTLISYRSDLEEYIGYVDIIVPEVTLNICISTSVGEGFSSKQDFIAKMNERYQGVHLNFLSSVTKDCDYLIWSGVGTPTSKVQRARKYGIPILSGAEFEAVLKDGSF